MVEQIQWDLGLMMTEASYSRQALVVARKRAQPEARGVLQTIGETVFATASLSSKTRQLIAVAVAYATQCPYSFNGHIKAALRMGASPEEIMEAIWVAAEMQAEATRAHSLTAFAAIEDEPLKREPSKPGRSRRNGYSS